MSRLTQGSLSPVSRTGLSPAVARLSRRFRYQTATTTGLVRFRSPLLAESRLMSFPPATEMFQFAGFASRTYEFSTGYPPSCPERWVAPFGDPGINDRSHLPRAFRSVPRPSSPLSAKASTRCPSLSLDPTASAPPLRDPTTPPGNRRAQPQRQRQAPHPRRNRGKTLSRPLAGRHFSDRCRLPPDRRPPDTASDANDKLPPAARPPRSHSQIRFTLHQTPLRPGCRGRRRGTPARPRPAPRNETQIFSECQCPRSQAADQPRSQSEPAVGSRAGTDLRSPSSDRWR